ncbi:MAG TPA: glycosyltransferase family 39 protein, partial [Ktedonobacterales bacterium]
GFTPFAIFLPQALAGVLSVLLLFHLVRRHFGVVAGLLAALALAISPISVVTNRNNTIDSTLVLAMLLGAWAVMRAAETGRLRWLLLCAVFIGLGFNIKMLEAYLVVPAFGLLYLLAAPKRLRTRLWHLGVAVLLMLVISLSWATIVDLTPASQRPYVGSSQNNSELSLAIGYNGIQRLEGMFGGKGNASTTGGTAGANGGTANGGPPSGFTLPEGGPPSGFERPIGSGTGAGGPGGAGPSTGMFNTGNPGILRLFTQPLGGQIVWLLPLALLGMLALAWQRRPRFRDDRQQHSLILWGMWLLTMAIFFSVASFFHQYYLSTLAPAISALFGIGIVIMWRDYRSAGWRGWLLPLALLLTAAEQVYIIETDPSWGTWLIPFIAAPCVLAAAALVGARLLPRMLPYLNINLRTLAPTLALGVAALLLTPAVWSAIPAVQNITQDLPIAGASQQGIAGGAGGGQVSVNTALISYLEAHQGSARYLVAVGSSQEADSIILATNKPVMALGGFSGSDPILTTSQLASLVATGTVRFFLLGGNGGGGGPGGGSQSSLTSWVTTNCTAVSSSQVQSSSDSSGLSGFASQLYDCASTTK